MSLKKYRFLDILIFSFIMILFDILLLLVVNKYIFSTDIENISIIGSLYLSISPVILIIVYNRWRYYGIITNVLLLITHFIIYMVLTADLLTTIFHVIALLPYSLLIFTIRLNKGIKLTLGFWTIVYFITYLLSFFVEYLLNTWFYQQLDLGSFGLFHSVNFFLGFLLLVITVKQSTILMYQIDFIIESQNEEKKEYS